MADLCGAQLAREWFLLRVIFTTGATATTAQVSKNPVYLNKLNNQSRGGASGGGVDMAEEIAMQESLNMTLA